MTALLTAMLPALFPALADGVRGIFSRITGAKGSQPQNVNEVLQLMQAETERLKTLAQLDAAGDCHKWVNDIRALQRPAVAFMVISAYAAAIWTGVQLPESALAALGEYAAMVTFYLFGDRSYSAMTRGKK